jgi:hypothetical protein
MRIGGLDHNAGIAGRIVSPQAVRAYQVSREATTTQKLVAGTVTQPVDFVPHVPAAPSPASAPAVLQMYTRAADKVEVAVAVALGRTIDLKA